MDNAVLQSYLMPEETVLWSGKPQRKVRFERKQIPILLFTIPFIAMFLLGIVNIAFNPESPEKPDHGSQTSTASSASQPTAPSAKTSSAEKIVGFLFALCFFGAFIGFFVYAVGNNLGGGVLLKRVDTYAVTSQRLIVFSTDRKPVRSILLSTAYDIRQQEWPDGLGTITFGPEVTWPYSSQITRNNPTLENIAEPRKVFQIIAQARKSA